MRPPGYECTHTIHWTVAAKSYEVSGVGTSQNGFVLAGSLEVFAIPRVQM